MSITAIGLPSSPLLIRGQFTASAQSSVAINGESTSAAKSSTSINGQSVTSDETDEKGTKVDVGASDSGEDRMSSAAKALLKRLAELQQQLQQLQQQMQAAEKSASSPEAKATVAMSYQGQMSTITGQIMQVSADLVKEMNKHPKIDTTA